MADFGYDVSNYTDVDPLFGNLATFDRLVSEAHKRDLRVIIDWVPNHTSDQHPWFVESRSSRDNRKRDWYYWRDAKPDGSPPNNWLSVFGGSAWEWDAQTGQYYLHSFLKEQPDLNWRNPAVKAAMFEGVRFWLERGVDGFRIDVAHYVAKDPELRDNPLNPPKPPSYIVREPREPYDLYDHIHDKGHADVHGIFRELRLLLDAYSTERPRYAVGETYIWDTQEWASYYGANLDELHMPFNFALLFAPWNAEAIRAVLNDIETAVPAGAYPNYVMGNHDQPRIAARLGWARARQAAVLLLTLRGAPTLYMGDELGMMGVEIPPERQKDPYGRRVPGQGRDACRTPMQWSAAPNARFCEAGVEPWLPVQLDYQEVNVERELEQPDSMLNLYRRLLDFRRTSPALQWGTYRWVDGVPENCYVFLREVNGERILVAFNFSDLAQTANVSALGSGSAQISTHMDREGREDLANLRLRPFEAVVVRLDE